MREFVLAATTGSGGPLDLIQWLTMRNDLSVPPRLGLQSNFDADVGTLYVDSPAMS